MPKKFFKKWIPHPDKVRKHPRLNRIFGTLLHDPNLLHLNRRSVSGAFFIGLFIAFIPIPLQMVLAAALAIYFRTNLPLSVGLVWISNPVTIPPLSWFCYKVGSMILDTRIQHVTFEISYEWITNELLLIWQPFLLGCFLVGLFASLAGGFGVSLIWRYNVSRQWHLRKMLRDKKILK
ncbi:MAG: DUF2062 domain-containing protein [Gammaproteobacteria bacterium]|nr:DUF2062 domain-containing protein [Gammaproteobacteria bacterium]